MTTMKRQQGMTGIGWVLVILLVIFFTLLTVKLFPIYYDAMKVGSILSELEDEPGIGAKSPGELMTTIVRRFNVNVVTDVSRDDVYIERSGQMTLVEIQYEARRNLFGNIDIVVSFDKKAEIPRN